MVGSGPGGLLYPYVVLGYRKSTSPAQEELFGPPQARLPTLGARWTWLNNDDGLFAMVAERYRQPWHLSLESLPNSPIEPIGIIHNQKSARDDSGAGGTRFQSKPRQGHGCRPGRPN